MKTVFITLIAIVFGSAAIFIGAPDLCPQTNRGMKISVRTNTGEEIELYKASYALIVGNGNYRNGWDPLPGATRDVQEVAAALKTHGFNVTLKTDLTKDKFEDAFETFVQNGKNEDARLLFYYAGHGYTEELADGEHLGYLVMVDAPFPKNDGIDGSKSVDMESLVTQSRRMQSRHVLFMFDSCFSGTILNARSQIPPPYVSNNVKYPVRQFITAGRADETVPDHSVFKEAFLNLVKGIAQEPIADGYITGAELGLYLKTEVPKYNRGQNPQYGKINNPKLNQGDFVFVLPREAPPPPGDALSTIATLNVTSTPRGATVYLEGIVIGKTPMRGYQIDTGVRRVKQVHVRLESEGYKSRTTTLTLKGGQSMPWTVRLEKFATIATLQVTSTPNGASVYLDGAAIGKTPLRGFEVDTGTTREKQVELGIELPGYKSQVRGVTLRGGQEVPWDVQLEKRARPKPAAMPASTEMVLIPAGEFQMGSNDHEAYSHEKPMHTVYVDAFYIDKYEVTNAQFKAFVDANPQWQKDKIDEQFAMPTDFHGYLMHWDGNNYPRGKSNHPVRHVSWYAAIAYAQWAGKRLPTEAEWEKAARGGLVGKKYPWGNAIDISQANYNKTVGNTMPVGTYPPNGYGLYDMAGNVWEWCLDAYDSYARSTRRNPLAGEMNLTEVMTNYKNVTTSRVLRGGSWIFTAQDLRVAGRGGNTPASTDGHFGFRCARDVTQGGQEVQQDVQLETQARPKPAAIPDTTEMVLIPAGDFQMGSNDSDAGDDEKPAHTVYVDAFYIDTYEVTNAQFKTFVDANPQWQKNRIPQKYHSGNYLQDWSGNSYPSGKGNHPVRYVSWYAAMAYAQWAGKRLPTEAEWEKAARGGLVDKKYPWGNAIDTSQANYNKDVGNTTQVGTYAPNRYGLYDMAGNVWEWCLDAHEEGFYARSQPQNPLAGEMNMTELMTNYQNVNVTTSRVLRGGSWGLTARDLRVANRNRFTPANLSVYIGFRCARAVTQGGQEGQRDVQLEKQAIPQQGAHTSTILGKDGTEMVRIPAGDFQMGSNDSDAEDNEKPVHTVYVDAFYIDKYEVTNAQFKAFVDANPPWQKNRIPKKYRSGLYLQDWSGNSYPSGKGNHPVVYVSWYAAMAYAQWAGKRLPTEAEWEKAARGGLVDEKYPWGYSIDASKANYGKSIRSPTPLTTPVGMYAPNGYGLYDMAGNVWEWCLDAYEADFYTRSPRRNPLASEMTLTEVMTNYQNVTTSRVLRGGGWPNSAQNLRVAPRGRFSPTNANGLIGFRCARDVTP